MIPLLLALALTPARADDDSKQREAESAFDAVMLQNAVSSNPATVAPVAALGYVSGGNGAGARAATPGGTDAGLGPVDAQAEVPLSRYEDARARIAEAAVRDAQAWDTLVVLGGSTWTGRATPAGLELHLTLQATLRGPGFWKAVPVVGDQVAIVRARVGNETIALTNQNGYQVWVTDRVGEVSVDVDVLVPTDGPRGSLEYDFLVARTPITRFDCSFPEAGIEPRLRGAVRSELSESSGGTDLSAFLEPTSRIHLVGFRDLGEDADRAAKVYVETLSLLSITEGAADLFSVFRYSILQSGTRQFDILVPEGLNVVSADGAGGFRYTLEDVAEGTIIHGETVFPIRDSYEVSLRLAQPHQGGTLDVRPPRAVGAERESGWIGLEVLGTVQVEERALEEAVAVDVSQLPEELAQNAVSPVLDGWRYHSAGAHLTLDATPLPEREPAVGSIDEVEATTRLASEGRSRTELRITLRNRLRHSLSLRLPEGVEIRSARIDGEAITPSMAEDGAVVLPLRRSAGDVRPRPFTVEVELEGDVGAFSLLGIRELQLPTFSLPVSTLRWTVEAPAVNRYSRLYGDVAPQDPGGDGVETSGDRRTLRHTRYWIAADRPVTVEFGYVRGWLRIPLALVGVIGLVVTGLRGRRRWPEWSGRKRAGLGLAWGLGVVALGAAAGGLPVAAVLGTVAFLEGLLGWVRGAGARVWERLRAREEGEPVPGSWRARGFFGRTVLLLGTAGVGSVLFFAGLRLMYVLANPLG